MRKFSWNLARNRAIFLIETEEHDGRNHDIGSFSCVSNEKLIRMIYACICGKVTPDTTMKTFIMTRGPLVQKLLAFNEREDVHDTQIWTPLEIWTSMDVWASMGL